MTKLTLVSVSAKGRKNRRFVRVSYVEGKAVVPQTIINEMLQEIGITERGVTYTVG